MHRIKTFLLFVGISSNFYLLLAQEEKSDSAKKLILSTSSLEYFPNKLNCANYNLGAEFFLKNRKSLALNIGYLFSDGSSDNFFQIASLGTRGFKIQLDGKYFLNSHKIIDPLVLVLWPHIFQYKTQNLANSGYYLSGNVNFQHSLSQRSERIESYNNIYSVNRNALALHFKIGYQCIKKYGLVIDFVFGAGAQYISSESNNKSVLIPESQSTDTYLSKKFDHGAGFYPGFVYQFKLGWAFF